MKEQTKQVGIIFAAIVLIFLIGMAADVGEKRASASCAIAATQANFKAEEIKEICK